jgi:hypothetical protein
MRYNKFTTAKIHIVIIWVMTPCRLVVGYQHFTAIYCLLQVNLKAVCSSQSHASLPDDSDISPMEFTNRKSVLVAHRQVIFCFRWYLLRSLLT